MKSCVLKGVKSILDALNVVFQHALSPIAIQAMNNRLGIRRRRIWLIPVSFDDKWNLNNPPICAVDVG